MADDIETYAGTRHRAIVAKVLRDHYPARNHDLNHHIRAAAAILLALDEDTNDREIRGELDKDYANGVAVAARADAVAALSRVVCRAPGPEAMDRAVDRILANAERIAAYIRDGQVTG